MRRGLIRAACAAAVSITALAWATEPGPRFRPDGWHADEFGQAEGYPVGTRATRSPTRFLIGAYSRGDTVLRTRDVGAPLASAPLARAAQEPAIRYGPVGATRSLDDYLDEHPTTGLLIARGHEILMERYQYDRRDTDGFTSQSMAKTITGLLVGIAVSEGQARSIDDAAEAYVPALRGSEFGRTPIRALLQMSSGIGFRHGFDDNSAVGDLAILNRGPGGAQGLRRFDRRVAPPGTRFNYSAADNRVLGLVLAGATGRTVSDYAREKLWEPLGAEAKATWQIDGTGQEVTSCCFAARLRDWARLGLMLAHDGAWRGRQVVPRDWLLAGTSVAQADAHLRAGKAAPGYGYGYQVWLLPGPGRMFALRGLRGQVVAVDPATKTVMVHTAVLPYHHNADAFALWSGVIKSLPER